MQTLEIDAAPLSTDTFPVWAGPTDRIRFLLGYALMAPSRHNSQPWIFEIEGDEVRIYADRTRSLPVCDPDGRELVMACGAALQNLRLAAAHFGYATSSEIVARPRDDLLARLRLEERHAATPRIEELFAAIPRRRTNRLPFEGREPPPGLVAELCRGAGTEGASLRAVEDPQRVAVAELIAEGDRLQWGSARFRAEVAEWTRFNATRRGDGMPGYSSGMSDAASLLQPLVLRLADSGPAEASRDRRRALGCPVLLVLSTFGEETRDWLSAGEALERILLGAMANGLHASYFNQPIENAGLRARLREVLGETGHPQVMFRLGYGPEMRPPPRRPVQAVLRAVAPEPAPPQPLATMRR
jgi:hypothetical protein